MNDYDNLPHGITPADALNAGITRHDDSFLVHAKLMTQHAQDAATGVSSQHHPAGAAGSSGMAGFNGAQGAVYSNAGGQSSGRASDDYWSFLNHGLGETRKIGNEIASHTRKLVDKRANETRSRYLLLKVTGVVLLALLLVIFTGFSWPSLTYHQREMEYIFIRLLTLAVVIAMCLAAYAIEKVNKRFAAEERRLRTLASCFLEALRTGYDINLEKTKKDPHDFFSPLTFGNVRIPSKLLTARFLHRFNQLILQKTGKPMDYKVYMTRFETRDGRNFVVANNVILAATFADLGQLVSLEELDTLARQER